MYYSEKNVMHLPIDNAITVFVSRIFFVTFLILVRNGYTTAAQNNTKSIGAIIDVNSRTGKEEKISMEIAIQTLTNSNNKLMLHVIDSGGNPLQASTAADYLTKVKKVQAIVGMETWPQTALVADATIKAQVPILSLATPTIASVLASIRWPFLARMANNDALQMQCIASIVSSYGWRKVITVYEDEGYNTDPVVLTLLSDALQEVGSEIEYRLALPSFFSLTDPKSYIQEELEKLISQQSRAFIIVGASLEIASYIMIEAKQMGLMGKNSVWITTDSVTNSLHAANSSLLSSLNGVIGIKTHFSKRTPSFLRFSTEFRIRFQSAFPEERSEPGIYALRAYDIISTMALAFEKSMKENNSTTRSVLKNILSSNFSGLSGKIRFEGRELSSSPTYEIINVVGKSYPVLKYWSSDCGFSDKAIENMSTQERSISGRSCGSGKRQVLGPRVYWPGRQQKDPLGWVMPTDAEPLVIGVPGRTSFEKFVKVKDGEDPTGFCIDVFKEALKLLNYDLPHKFEAFDGTYEDLVDQVYFKKFGAVVGDITILANRSKYVDFTQPFAESGLTMVVPVKTEKKAWLFVKPFSKNLWLVVTAVFVYTMFVVWFLEHRSNQDFRGPWKNQLSTAMWFTLSTLFFAHRETLRSNYTRVVMFVWLFTVFVVTSSYTASLTSMLTVRRLDPTVTDIQMLKRNNYRIGCDGDSFVRKYMEDVLHFHPNNIINITSQYDYPDAFKNGTIKAAILELPYERVFLSINSKDYQDAGLKHRFGGLGFVFPKGSPMATDFSKAFLQLSEEGTLTKLDQYWFKSSDPINSDDSMNNQSLGLSNFSGLFLVTTITSSLVLILYIIHLYTNFRSRSIQTINNEEESVWIEIKRLVTYYDNTRRHHSHRDPDTSQSRDGDILMSSTRESLSQYNTPRNPESTERLEDMDNQTRALRSSYSFPVWDRPGHRLNHADPQ